MDNFSKLSRRITATATMITVASFNLFTGTSAMADTVDYGARSKQVTVSDLDLTTADGQKVLQERLHQMARRLCTQVADPLDLSHQKNYVDCVAAAMTQANASVLARINQHQTTKLARADVK